MKRENGEHWALLVHCLSLLRHYFGVTLDHCHRGLREKMVTDRKAKLKKQCLLRKEVNRTYQNALAHGPINPTVQVSRYAADD